MRESGQNIKILGLEAGATKEEVKEAYRDLVHVWHPDRFAQNSRLQKKAEEKLKEINAAYEELMTRPWPKAIPASSKHPPPSPPPAARETAGAGPFRRAEPRQPPPQTPRLAILELKKALRKNPQDAGGHYNLGVAFLSLGRSLEALNSFQKAVHLAPSFAAAHLGQGVAFSRLGRGLQALSSIRLALSLKPDDPLTHLNLGIAYRQLGRHLLGQRAIIQAIRLAPDSPEAHYQLGLTNLCLENRVSALQEYKILLKLDPKLAYKLFSLIYQQ
jgi:tetratricopeptide (TPR) repeat protein